MKYTFHAERNTLQDSEMDSGGGDMVSVGPGAEMGRWVHCSLGPISNIDGGEPGDEGEQPNAAQLHASR